jgi:hypothetical protein
MGGEVLVAMGLRTGIGKEAVMAAAVGEEDFNMVKEVGRRVENLINFC